ncbi:NAD(P)-binding domain protein [Metarhizium guizhouense ARSEF 977]|uniref:Hydroxynaphthalene reductase-like protein Arp2 n=1 Tax=Metarhizium guizhouense (strain ARSEF 977) TaxID=1276136 RepID=A0A0B4H505_METGA|nr:NAD(P)-binding domain protein [Metarhizium guizhouense ARSEF 977]
MALDTLSLAGKSAIITGSGRENGIGAAIARALARNGANVAIHHVSEESKSGAEKVAAELANEYGVETTVVRGSIDDCEAAKAMVSQTISGLGVDHVDILVNNAAETGYEPLLEASPEHLQKQFAVNVFGPVYLTQAAIGIGKMPKGGRIINIGSVASKMGLPIAAIHSAAKAAQDSLTASWASELGHKYGITVNTVALGPIPTDSSKQYLINPDGTPSSVHDSFIAQTRAGSRLGTPDDVADAVLLLVSEKSRWITAQWISVSGGITGTM